MRLSAKAALLAACAFALPAAAQDLSSQRDYADPAQRDRPIACKPGDIEKFPGKSLGEVFGADWPKVNGSQRATARLLEHGPIRWPAGLDPQHSFTVVAVLVDAAGEPVRAEVLCTTRMGLDAAVRRHALASTYAPAMVDGRPVAAPLVRVVSVRTQAREVAPRPRR